MRSADWYLQDDEAPNFSESLHNRTEELYGIPDATPDANGMIECPVLPLRDLVVYPRMVSPVFLSQEAAVLAVEDAQQNDHTVIALTHRDPEND